MARTRFSIGYQKTIAKSPKIHDLQDLGKCEMVGHIDWSVRSVPTPISTMDEQLEEESYEVSPGEVGSNAKQQSTT